MLGVDQTAWTWVLRNCNSHTFSLPYDTRAHENGSLKYLLTNGIISYGADFGFTLSDDGIATYKELVDLQEIVKTGRSIVNKDLVADLSVLIPNEWSKATIMGNVVSFDHACLFVGRNKRLRAVDIGENVPLELELKISSILDDYGNGLGVSAVPFAYQRTELFKPGVVWFRSESGNFAIQEVYYDLLFHYLGKWNYTVGLTLLTQDKRYLIVSYKHTKMRLDHSVVGIVAECIPLSWPNIDVDDEAFCEIVR